VKYRKYSLPEEPADGAAPHDPSLADTSPPPSASKTADSGSLGPDDDTLAPHNPRVAPVRGEGWHEEGPHGVPANADESIDIPGTHVPTGVVVAIVLSVVALLAATAFLLLR
jgi:hypothetical protein